MSADTIGAIAAVAAVLITVMGGLIALIYNAGRHAQRLDTHEKEIAKLQATQDEHSKAISAWDQVRRLVEEVRKDVKGLLAGRGNHGRTRTASDDQ